MSEPTAPPSSRSTASDRVHRVLAEALWIQDQDGPTVERTAERFGVSTETLLADLNLVTMIGADGDDFDVPVDMWFEGDRVFVYLRAFDRPLRLTPAEALSLVVSGLGLVESGPPRDSGTTDPPLVSALAKLAGVLGVEVGEQVDVTMGVGDARVFAVLREAVELRRAVRIDHLRTSSDTRSTRIVEPWGLFHDRGAWYLSGYCRSALAERVFRVDRIVDAVLLDEAAGPPPPGAIQTAFRADAGEPRIVLDLPPDARWVIETYPVEDCRPLGDGTLRATLVAASSEWVERLLLRLGPTTRIVDLDEPLGPGHPGAAAAERILARYGTGPRHE